MSEETSEAKLQLSSLAPALTVDDIEASLRFYTEVLGFAVLERFEQDGQLFGASLGAGKVQLLLGQDDWKKGRDRKKGVGFRIYCSTAADIDALAAAIKERGGELETEPTDQPWGARDFSVRDPDGFAISISTEV
jgi:uncharacterized glyoxalase superfamily protein PhnB